MISFNGLTGGTGEGAVIVRNDSAVGNSLSENAIFSNASLGIDVGDNHVPTLNDSMGHVGPNHFQNFPVLTAATNGAVAGTLSSTPNTTFRIEFFANAQADPCGYGEGQTYLGFVNVTTDGSGNASFTANLSTLVPTGQCNITATATNLSTGDTSEFAKDIPKLTTVTAVTSSANTSILGQAVTFTATVSGGGNATGTVQFQVDGINLGAPVNLIADTATISTTSLPVGPHTIAAIYSGDGCSYGSIGSLAQSIHYAFSGFLPPLNKQHSFSVGRTLPIKFQLRDGNGIQQTALSDVTSLQIQSLDSLGNPVGAPFNPVSAKKVGLAFGNGDDTNGADGDHDDHFIFYWKTKGLAIGSYQIVLKLNDGTVQTVTLQLKKQGEDSGLVSGGSGIGGTAGALLAGNIELYVDNSSGYFTTDELARIDASVAAVDAVVGTYGAYITEVTDPTQATFVLDSNTTSAVGGFANGVLGCTTDAGEITLIQGWNFFAGSDSTQIGASQYDFQTVVTHELGHALGLGHSSDATSVMYASLNTSTSNHTLVTADLNIPDVDNGACGLHAAVPSVGVVGASLPTAGQPGVVTAPAPVPFAFGGQSLATVMAFDPPHLVAALLDSSFRSPYTTALLAAPTVPALVAQQHPAFFVTNEVGSRLPWEQRPMNWGMQDLILAEDSGSGEATDESTWTASEPIGNTDLLDSYQY
jgi:hypothetical protein